MLNERRQFRERDLPAGQKTEREAAECLLKWLNARTTQKYEVVEVQDDSNHKTTHYDFKISNGIKSYTYEVKDDKRSEHTGNFFIEFEDSGKPSCLSITTADFHIFKSCGYFYKIQTTRIHRLLKVLGAHGELETKRVCRKWDDGRINRASYRDGYIVPTKYVTKQSVCLNPSLDSSSSSGGTSLGV